MPDAATTFVSDDAAATEAQAEAPSLAAWMRRFSTELTPRTARRIDDLASLLPAGKRVFVAAPPGWKPSGSLALCRQLIGDGMRPVPHLPARRFATPAQARRLVRNLGEAGVTEVLAIAGDVDPPLGPMEASLDMLREVDLEANGITRLWVAGHPERHPQASRGEMWRALRAKDEFARAAGLDLGIVTQFTFDGAPVARYLAALYEAGIDRPVRLGVHGVIKPRTLLHFGSELGLRHTLASAWRHAGMVLRLARVTTPETILRTIAEETPPEAAALVDGVHFFPFGAFRRTAAWARNFPETP